MRNNRGYSLIELLVTVIIAGILGSVLVMSLTSIFASEASKTAKNLNSSLSRAKVQSMSRAGQTCISIYRDAEGRVIAEYYENQTIEQTDVLGGRQGALSYKDSAGNTVALESAASRLYLAFERDTGALKTIGGAAAAAIGDMAAASLGNGGAWCESILIETDTRSFEISLVRTTGKHELRGG